MSAPKQEMPQGPTPDLGVVVAAYSDIVAHNSEHTGLGAMFSGMLKGLAAGSDEVVNSDNLDSAASEEASEAYKAVDKMMEEGVVEGEMNADLQGIFHNDTFMRAGIKIAPFGQFGANSQGEAVTSKELVPVIENTSLFTEFLGKLKPEDVQNEDAETFLCDVVASLSRVAGVCFDKRKHEDLSDEEKTALVEAGENALRTFLAIDPEYARLGINGAAMRKRVEGISAELSDFLNSGRGGVVPAEIREEYSQYMKNQRKMRVYEGMSNKVHYWGRNVLPEYLVAQSGQYLVPPNEQSFGPAQWHTDGGQKYWRNAVEFVAALEEEDRTRDFCEEVRRSLADSLDYAVKKIDQNKDPAMAYAAEQRGDLTNVKACLLGQPFDPEAFVKYTEPPNYGSSA